MYIPTADMIVGDIKMCRRKEFIQLTAILLQPTLHQLNISDQNGIWNTRLNDAATKEFAVVLKRYVIRNSSYSTVQYGQRSQVKNHLV